MSNDVYHEPIKLLLQKHGALGVNALQKELNIPLSTLQKYLDKQQTYFKKNHARKWVLPEVSVKEDMSAATNNYANLIDGQLSTLNALINTLMSQFSATVTLIEANKPVITSVADKTPDIHPRLLELDKKIQEMQLVFKRYVGKCPEEYRDLLSNVDFYQLTINKGRDYMNEVFSPEISALFLEKTDSIPDDVLKVIETYQKNDK